MKKNIYIFIASVRKCNCLSLFIPFYISFFHTNMYGDFEMKGILKLLWHSCFLYIFLNSIEYTMQVTGVDLIIKTFFSEKPRNFPHVEQP